MPQARGSQLECTGESTKKLGKRLIPGPHPRDSGEERGLPRHLYFQGSPGGFFCHGFKIILLGPVLKRLIVLEKDHGKHSERYVVSSASRACLRISRVKGLRLLFGEEPRRLLKR